MMLGRVIGEVWASQKHPRLHGAKLLLVAALKRQDEALLPTGEVVVARDTLGAGAGHLVAVTWGSGARRVMQPQNNRDVLADAAIVRILDGHTHLDEMFSEEGGPECSSLV